MILNSAALESRQLKAGFGSYVLLRTLPGKREAVSPSHSALGRLRTFSSHVWLGGSDGLQIPLGTGFHHHWLSFPLPATALSQLGRGGASESPASGKTLP